MLEGQLWCGNLKSCCCFGWDKSSQRWCSLSSRSSRKPAAQNSSVAECRGNGTEVAKYDHSMELVIQCLCSERKCVCVCGGGVRLFVCCKEMLIEENGDQKYIQETAEMIAAPWDSSCYSFSGWKQLGIQTKKQVRQVSVNLATRIFWQILTYHWLIKALRDEMEANLQPSVVGVGFGVSHKSDWKS